MNTKIIATAIIACTGTIASIIAILEKCFS